MTEINKDNFEENEDSANVDIQQTENDGVKNETKPHDSESAQSEEEKKKGFWKDLIQTIVLAALIFLVLNTLTSRVKVFNVSMQPTLKQGYLLLVNKMAYKWGEPKRGD
ncbi:MAG TPA: S26 family signal peptidase, partial [Anaerolineaceae bacterium]|nr:S26 family signal peptidase [Anaerolineaceae bacterium]